MPDRGRRDWSEAPDAQAPVYGQSSPRAGPSRTAVDASTRGDDRVLVRPRLTGGMRRTHLRGHTNILKRLLIHVGGFNLGLIMRQRFGVGTPRGLQGRLAAAIAVVACWRHVDHYRNETGRHSTRIHAESLF